jgi:hypothetical protein
MTVGLVIPYFMATSGKPGAMIELANGVTKVYIETWHEMVNQRSRKFDLTDET